MTFTVSQEDEINVYRERRLFFKACLKNGIRYSLRFFKEDSLILETRSFSFILFKKIWIKEQYLPDTIELAKQNGFWGFITIFGDFTIYTKQRPLRNPAYRLYLNEQLKGEVWNDKGVTIGRHYVVTTDTEDETLNLYLLIAFIIQFIAL